MYFRPNLAAELHYKTLNGDVYTDFAMIPAGDTNDGLEQNFAAGDPPPAKWAPAARKSTSIH